MLGAVVSFMIMAVCARELSDTMNTFQILFLRSIVGFPILLFIVVILGGRVSYTKQPKIHILRNVLHYGAQAGWVLGVTLLPLATVFAIEFTAPIWVAIMSVLFLNEKLSKGRLVAIFFGFGGTLIILRPGLEAFEAGSLAVLLASIGLAASLVFTKLLSKTETPLSIVFYMTGIQALVGLLAGLIVWVTPNIGDFIWIGAIAIVGLTSHFCLAKALTYADVTVIIPFDFLRLPLAAVVGFFLYHEELEFAVLAGGAIIFLGNYYNIRMEHLKNQRV